MNMKNVYLYIVTCLFVINVYAEVPDTTQWQSEWVQIDKNGKINYKYDEKGNRIPDFSRVGYHHSNIPIPVYCISDTITYNPNIADYSDIIQEAINSIGKRPINNNGHRGALLIKKGIYNLSRPILINNSGIVLRGEGTNESGTQLVATWKSKHSIIQIKHKESSEFEEIPGTRVAIKDKYVAVGTHSFFVDENHSFKKGDRIILLRPGTINWIHDLKMDQIKEKSKLKQWKPEEYNLKFEREITNVDGNRITIDNPVVMEMSEEYGGGYVYKYRLDRIKEIGIEDIMLRTNYSSEYDEKHAWKGIEMDFVENAWVRNVTGMYLTYSTVSLEEYAKNVTVFNCRYLQPKGQVKGGRRYSFNICGQQNLVMYCMSEDGRHDYVTGARTLGPNVFYNCTAIRAFTDIGPHHRWSCGILFDNIVTDSYINVQDRGNWGTGHGWSGVNIVFWKCTGKMACVQQPWVTGTNYCIGFQGEKYSGRLPGRLSGIWEGQFKKNLVPVSLFTAQLTARMHEIYNH